MRTESYRRGVTVATAEERLYLAGLLAVATCADEDGGLRFWQLAIGPRGEMTRKNVDPVHTYPARVIAALSPLLANLLAPAPIQLTAAAPFVSLAPLPFVSALRQPAAREQGDGAAAH